LSRQTFDEIAPPEGREDLRRAIAARLQRVNRFEVDPAGEVVVTQGGQEAAFLMVAAAAGPGDEVIVPEPNYYSYGDAIRWVGATPVPVRTLVENGFTVDPDRVRSALTDRTCAMLLVSPNNPSAAVLSPDVVHALVELADAHDLLILADDTYDQFLYEDAVHTSPAALRPARGRTLTVNTCSKTYAMTGWRVGWIAGPAPLMARVRALKAASTGGTSTLAQAAALEALTGPQGVVADMLAAYARRRSLTLAALDAMGLPYGKPMGGQFVFIDIRSVGLSSLAFAEQLLERGRVLVGSGAVFGADWDGFVRLAWLLPDDQLAEGLARMADAVRVL
jgi:aspartate/methionine/tyrosine aminotransferase